jgi:hypothetical protein
VEKPPLVHAVDLAVVVTGKDANHAAEALGRISSDMLDLHRKMRLRSLFLPSGTKTVNFVTYEDSLQLVMALGGKQANQMKTQFAKILTRYFAGDATMAEELRANAASSAPLNVLAGSKRVHNDSSMVQEPEVAYTVGAAPGRLI